MASRTASGLFGSKTPYDSRYDEVGWVNQNWLTHVLFYKMKTALGGDQFGPQPGELLIVLYKILQAIATALLAYFAARTMGANVVFAAFWSAFGILLSRSFVDLRPNVSSILFAAAMIWTLAAWAKGKNKALFWMIPIMLLWSNVHGGFIYAIMIFAVMIGGHLFTWFVQRLTGTNRLAGVDKRGMWWLLGTAVAVVLIPGIFSPFGMENLIHPLVVAAGQEGKVWRDVVEWRPIWDDNGFGNATPYLYFLGCFAVTFLLWLSLIFLRPVAAAGARRSRRASQRETIPWPQIDLPGFGVMGLTLIMSILSRRFIFLGGVVLAPYLARMMHEIVVMFRLLAQWRKGQPLELQWQWPTLWRRIWIATSVLALAALGTIQYLTTQDLYLSAPMDAEPMNIFRRMVGLPAQCVNAMTFLRENHIQGVVFNEWVHGGFISYHQVPREDNGQPPAKVHMDGRAQAAYELHHFKWWQALHAVAPPSNSAAHEQFRQYIAQQARVWGYDQDDPRFFDALFNMADTTDDKQVRGQYRTMAGITLNRPELFNALLEREGITAAMLNIAKSQEMYPVLMKSGNWTLVYFDGKYYLLLRNNAPENAAFFEKYYKGQLVYTDDETRNRMEGYRLSTSSDPRQRLAGLNMLLQCHPVTHMPLLYDRIYMLGKALRQYDTIADYFQKEFDTVRQQVDAQQRFGYAENLSRASHLLMLLERLARDRNRPNDILRYNQLRKQYDSLRNREAAEIRKGHWLW